MAQIWPNDITQHSTISALMAGYAEGGPPVSAITHYGDHALGTFPKLDGELVMIDSVAWQFTSDGKVSKAPSDARLPFVAVTRFSPTFSRKWRSGDARDDVPSSFRNHGDTSGGGNSFMPFRIRGTFKTIEVRIVAGQKHGESLSEVSDNAVHKTFSDVKGVIFGIYSPDWSQGISVAGVHCHFLSEEREDGTRVGGHALSWDMGEDGLVEWAVSGHFHLGLPNDAQWQKLDLTVDQKGISKSEG